MLDLKITGGTVVDGTVERLDVVLDDTIERRCLRPTALVRDRFGHAAPSSTTKTARRVV